MTGNARQLDKRVMRSSASPSAKMACFGSSDRFSNGSTAIAGRLANGVAAASTALVARALDAESLRLAVIAWSGARFTAYQIAAAITATAIRAAERIRWRWLLATAIVATGALAGGAGAGTAALSWATSSAMLSTTFRQPRASRFAPV